MVSFEVRDDALVKFLVGFLCLDLREELVGENLDQVAWSLGQFFLHDELGLALFNFDRKELLHNDLAEGVTPHELALVAEFLVERAVVGIFSPNHGQNLLVEEAVAIFGHHPRLVFHLLEVETAGLLGVAVERALPLELELVVLEEVNLVPDLNYSALLLGGQVVVLVFVLSHLCLAQQLLPLLVLKILVRNF